LNISSKQILCLNKTRFKIYHKMKQKINEDKYQLIIIRKLKYIEKYSSNICNFNENFFRVYKDYRLAYVPMINLQFV